MTSSELPVEQPTRVLIVSDDPRAASLCEAINRIAPVDAILREPSQLTVIDIKTSALVVDARSRPPPPEVNALLAERLSRPDVIPTLVLEAGSRDSLRSGRLPRELLANSDTGARLLSFALLTEIDRVADFKARKKNPAADERPSVPRLDDSNRLKTLGILAATVAHEVNNPATFVIANTEILREQLTHLQRTVGANGDETSKTLADCLSILSETKVGLTRIMDIVSTLRTFGQVQHEPVRKIDLRQVVQDAVTIVRSEVGAVASLELELEPTPLVAANAGKLMQVVVNLLVNAAHATPRGNPANHVIRVGTFVDHGEVVIRVRDTGVGIPGDLLPKIFEPFFTTKQEEGTGLGLALCAQTVREHGGRILAESVVGEGTTIEVRLPERTGLRVRVTPELPFDRPVLSRARVLVVDDEPMILRAFQRLLERHHEVLTAEGGRAAVRILEEGNDVDAIVCDLMMPDIDGAGLHSWICSHRPDLAPRILFVSGGAYTVRLKDFVRDISNEVLDKPISASALRSALAQLLRESERPRAL